MISTLRQKDKDILLTNKSVDLNFGDGSNDYVEAFLYDTNDNFVVSGIVDREDYIVTNVGVKLNTGTIIRKLGYDRGRYRIRYKFLRKLAGSYETILVDSDSKIYNGPYHVMNNGVIMTGEEHSADSKRLFIKENKYITHQISTSRTEIRLIAQNINDRGYIDDLFFSSKRRKKTKKDCTINFTGTKPAKESIELESSVPFNKNLEGGLLYLENVFIERLIEQETSSAESLPPGVIPDEETIGDIQARIKISDTSQARIKSGNVTTSINNMWNDFKQFDTIESIQSQINKYESDLGKQGNKDMRKSLYSEYKTAEFEKDSIVKIKSISQKPGAIPVKYLWTLSGLDFTKQESYDGIVSTDEAQILENGSLRYLDESTTGSEISVKLTGNNTDVCVTLQIESKAANGNDVKSVIYLPNILRTVKQ